MSEQLNTKRISELSSATTPLTGAELLPVEQGGAAKKLTLDVLASSVQRCSKVVLTATIAAADWTSSDPYTNSVSVNGLLATDTPIMDLIASSTYAIAQAETADYAYIYKATCADNALTLYASQASTVDLNVQLLCLR